MSRTVYPAYVLGWIPDIRLETFQILILRNETIVTITIFSQLLPDTRMDTWYQACLISGHFRYPLYPMGWTGSGIHALRPHWLPFVIVLLHPLNTELFFCLFIKICFIYVYCTNIYLFIAETVAETKKTNRDGAARRSHAGKGKQEQHQQHHYLILCHLIITTAERRTQPVN